MLLLVDGGAPDVGIFADSQYNLDKSRMDRIVGVGLAVLLFLGGAIPQLKAMKAKVEVSSSVAPFRSSRPDIPIAPAPHL